MYQQTNKQNKQTKKLGTYCVLSLENKAVRVFSYLRLTSDRLRLTEFLLARELAELRRFEERGVYPSFRKQEIVLLVPEEEKNRRGRSS